jgi:hypothetical protein
MLASIIAFPDHIHNSNVVHYQSARIALVNQGKYFQNEEQFGKRMHEKRGLEFSIQIFLRRIHKTSSVL